MQISASDDMLTVPRWWMFWRVWMVECGIHIYDTSTLRSIWMHKIRTRWWNRFKHDMFLELRSQHIAAANKQCGGSERIIPEVAGCAGRAVQSYIVHIFIFAHISPDMYSRKIRTVSKIVYFQWAKSSMCQKKYVWIHRNLLIEE